MGLPTRFGTGRVERVRGTFRTVPAEGEEGEAVARSACIELVARPGAARGPWHGCFALPDDAPLRSSGVYRLQLEDGRCGIAIITRFRVVNGAMVGSFRGSGPLQEADR